MPLRWPPRCRPAAPTRWPPLTACCRPCPTCRCRSGRLNPPLWELGHIGWFQESGWRRNPQRLLGPRADPLAHAWHRCAPTPTRCTTAARAHATRWGLPLPDIPPPGPTWRPAGQHAGPAGAGRRHDDGLYFFRLALLHEDMHHEAALYMAQAWALPVTMRAGRPAAARTATRATGLRTRPLALGSAADDGFAFDNELAAHDGGAGRHRDRRAGAALGRVPALRGRAAMPMRACGPRPAMPGARPAAPRAAHLRLQDGAWQQHRHGRWQPLDRPSRPATSPPSRPRPGAAGRAAACPPRPSGSAPPQPARGLPLGRCVGMDGQRLRRPTRASRRTPTATTQRPGSTAGRCCAAARS
jgi:hypothetical protein